jgi:hypothetical protein
MNKLQKNKDETEKREEMRTLQVKKSTYDGFKRLANEGKHKKLLYVLVQEALEALEEKYAKEAPK